jgi:hypothetical protein
MAPGFSLNYIIPYLGGSRTAPTHGAGISLNYIIPIISLFGRFMNRPYAIFGRFANRPYAYRRDFPSIILSLIFKKRPLSRASSASFRRIIPLFPYWGRPPAISPQPPRRGNKEMRVAGFASALLRGLWENKGFQKPPVRMAPGFSPQLYYFLIWAVREPPLRNIWAVHEPPLRMAPGFSLNILSLIFKKDPLVEHRRHPFDVFIPLFPYSLIGGDPPQYPRSRLVEEIRE